MWKADYRQTTANLNIGTVTMTFDDGVGYSFTYTEDNVNKTNVGAFRTRARAAKVADKAAKDAAVAINVQLETFFNA